VRDTGTAVVAGIRDERVTFIAASLAYYAFVSLLPLLIIALTVASLVGGSAFADSLARRVGEALGPSAGDLVREALTASLAQAGASAFGVVVLLWSGLKLFRGLDIAFSVIYDTPVSGILGRIRNGVVALAAVVAGFGATVGGGTALALFELRVFGVDLLGPAGTIVLFAGLTVVLLPMYYVLPGGGVTVREALPGAVLAGVGWTVLQTGFRIYAAQAANQAYGVLSGVLLLVTLLYFAGMLLLIGVVLNAVLAGRVDTPMSDSDTDDTDASFRDHAGSGSGPGPDSGDADREDLEAEVAELRERLAEFEEQVDDRTVHREEVESDLRRYVRRRVRRGKARGWGPYLVLLYGTAMTLGAFYLLSGGWAVLAMVVVWLSTLGLYALMLVVGAAVGAGRLPGRLRDRFGAFRK